MPDLSDQNKFAFIDLDERTLPALLSLAAAPFATEDHHWRQLTFVEAHVRRMRCRSVLIEQPYVDRDYMEEHAVFYSRTLKAVPNHCTRVHFFTQSREAVKRQLRRIVRALETNAYKDACALLSKAYLGFAIIKPLPGSPVGRTVLRPRRTSNTVTCAISYPVHVLGARLVVEGLGFQQQDAGVSACATTAVWASLQNAAAFETITPAAPAQITMLASRTSLLFGRSMPSEGLSTGQMCDAIQGVGLAPNLVRVRDRAHALRLLFAITLSGFAPVLILSPSNQNDDASPSDEGMVSALRGDEQHAVALVGAEYRNDFVLGADSQGPFVAAATLLKRIIVHDDRIGPYVPAVFDPLHPEAILELEPPATIDIRCRWRLTHVLIALHPKIRLSFGGLQSAATRIMERASTALSTPRRSTPERDAIFVENWIEHGYKYINDLAADAPRAAFPWAIFTKFLIPRYVAVVRFAGERIGMLDVVFDTTSTERNIVVLAIVLHPDRGDDSDPVVETLREYLGCPEVRL